MVKNSAKYKPYPAYKPSGVEWLGYVPEHWKVKQLKYTAPLRNIKLYNKPEDTIYVGLENIEPWTGELLLDNQPDTVDGTVVTFNAGDVLFGKLRPYLAKAAHPDFGGTATSEVLVMKPASESSQIYLTYCLLNAPYIRWVDTLTYGAKMPRVSPDEVTCSFMPLPPLTEQRAIAAFLDRETARINELVARKERLIGLLQEKRTALITRAVTRGLVPNTTMKDSGVEWLGGIPEHWQVKRMKHLLREPLQYGANEPSSHTDSDSPRYVRITDIYEDGTLRDDTFRSIPNEIAEPYLLARGDLLFARSGATVGKTFRYDPSWGIAAYAGYLIRARFDERLATPAFVEYFTRSQSFADWILSNLIQSTIQNVSAERYANLVVPRPPIPEQGAIADFLDRETAKVDVLVAKVQEAIGRLKELRTALISAAVTGRIDVREGAG